MYISYIYIYICKYVHTHTHTNQYTGCGAGVHGTKNGSKTYIHIYMHIEYTYIHTNKHTHTHKHAGCGAAVDGARNSCKTSGRSAGTQPKIGRERPLQLDAYIRTHKCTFTRTLMYFALILICLICDGKCILMLGQCCVYMYVIHTQFFFKCM